jgi:hypothetical protein
MAKAIGIKEQVVIPAPIGATAFTFDAVALIGLDNRAFTLFFQVVAPRELLCSCSEITLNRY